MENENKPIAVRYADEVEAHTASKQALFSAQAEVETLKATVAGHVQKVEELNAAIEAANTEKAGISAERDEAVAKVSEVTAQVEAVTSERDTLKATLEVSPGHQGLISGGGNALKEQPGDKTEAMTYEEAQAAYAKITDPKEKAAFRADNAVELKLK